MAELELFRCERLATKLTRTSCTQRFRRARKEAGGRGAKGQRHLAAAGGVVLDPFAGSGTTLEEALRLGRRGVGIELNPDYVPLIEERCRGIQYPLIPEGGEVAHG